MMFSPIQEKNIVQKVIQNAQTCYDFEQQKLFQIGIHHTTEGEIRAAAGNFVECMLQNIFDSINSEIENKIVSKKGSTDYLSKSVSYKKNNMILIESKLIGIYFLKGKD